MGAVFKTFKGLLLLPWCVGLIYTLLFTPIQLYQLGADLSHVVKPILIRVQLCQYKCVCWFSLLFSFKNILALTSSVPLICGYPKGVILTLSVLLLIVRTVCTEVHKLEPHGWHTECFCKGAMLFRRLVVSFVNCTKANAVKRVHFSCATTTF